MKKEKKEAYRISASAHQVRPSPKSRRSPHKWWFGSLSPYETLTNWVNGLCFNGGLRFKKEIKRGSIKDEIIAKGEGPRVNLLQDSNPRPYTANGLFARLVAPFACAFNRALSILFCFLFKLAR